MQDKTLVGKIATNEVDTLGNVQGFSWKKGQRCLVKINDDFYSAEKLTVKKKVVLRNAQKTKPLPKLCADKLVYDTDGNLLGKIDGFEITSTLKVRSIALDTGERISVSKIAQNNDILLVRAPKPKKIKTTSPVDEKKQPTKPQQEVEPVEIHQQKPKRKYGDFSFLMGKIVDKTIVNFLGEVMIRRGEVVTRQVYLQAKKFGKLTELCLHVE